MNAPFFLCPAGKAYLWGGSRLRDEYGKQIDLSPLAETWECSTHPEGVSIVRTGEYRDMSLREVLRAHPEFLGTHPRAVMAARGLPEHELPVLIKLIDAKLDLSIQVHPDDGYAKEHEHGRLGKTEMWYVMDAAEDARLICGLHRDMGKQELRDAIFSGTIEKYLRKVPVKKNDVFYVPAGMIHAIGAGVLLAEIQESSTLTYRLYDYDRADKNGRKRELHIDKALEVSDLRGSDGAAQPMRVLRYRKGIATEQLCRCRYFMVERMLLNTERSRETIEIRTGSTSFSVLLCVEGRGTIRYPSVEGEEERPFFRGDCIFLPAESPEIRLHGAAQLLKVSC